MHLGLGNSQKAKRFRKFVTRFSTKFDGTDDEITASGVTTLAGASAFTLSGWFKKADAGHRVGISYDNSSNVRTSILYNTDSNVYFSVATAGANYGAFSLASTDWVHLVMVFDGSASGNANRLKGYLDGVEQTLTFNSTIPAAAHSQSAIFRIGKDEGHGAFSQGSIDEVSVFSSALTAREVDALYNNGRPTKIRTNPNLAHWYRMGEGKLDGKSDGDENLMFDQGPNGGLGSELVKTDPFGTGSWSGYSGNDVTFPNTTTVRVDRPTSGGSDQGAAADFNTSILQSTPAAGTTLKISFDLNTDDSDLFAQLYNGSAFTNTTAGSGSKTVFLTMTGTGFIRFGGLDADKFVELTNLTIREVQNVGTISGAAIQEDGGTELVANGGFESSTTNWTARDSATITSVNGKLKVSNPGGSNHGSATQQIAVVTGRTYRATADLLFSLGTAADLQFKLGNSLQGIQYYNSGDVTSDSTQDVTFTATNTTLHVTLQNSGNAGTDGYFDNVSVKEVTESVPKQCKNLPSAASLKSLSFDGTDDVLDLGPSDQLITGTNVTVSMWFKIGDTSSGAERIFFNSRDGNATNLRFIVNTDGTFTAGYKDSSSILSTTSSGAVDDDLWHHAVFTTTSSAQVLYIDGVSVATTSNTFDNGASSTVTTTIGAQPANNLYANVDVDEFAIWDTVLDGDAVKALYNAGEPTPVITNTGAYDIYRDNLQAYYKMGDATNPAADGTNNLLFDQTNPGLGSELITNGDFSSASGWTADSNAAITGGKLVLTGSSGLSYQNIDLDDGEAYEVTFTIENFSSGTVKAYLNGTNGTARSANGTYTEIVLAGSANTLVGVNPSGSMHIDNFSVKKLNGHTGTISGATIQTNSPKQIYALPAVANTKSINFTTDDHLVTQVDDTLATRYYSFWLKSSDTGHNPVFDHGASNVGAFHLNLSGNRPFIYLGNTAYRDFQENAKQDDGLWHHYVVLIDADITKARLFIDAEEQTVNSTVSSGSPNAYTSGLRIGRASDVYFEGSIDEFSIHEELDDEAIRALYNRGRPIDISSNHGAYDLSDKALHWWRMGDATSPAADGTNDVIFQGLEFEGDEMFPTNAAASDWASLNNMTWDGTTLSYAGTGGEQATAQYLFTLPVGQTFRLTVDIENDGTGNFFGRVGDGNNSLSLSNVTTGTYEVVHTVTESGANNTLFFIVNSSFSGSISNISLNRIRGQYSGLELMKADSDLYIDSRWYVFSDPVKTYPNGTAARFTNPSTGGWNQGGRIFLTAGSGTHALTENMETGCVYKLSFDFQTDDSDAAPSYHDGTSATSLASGSGSKTFYFAYSGNAATRLEAVNVSASKFVEFSKLSLTKVGGAAVMTNMDSASDIQLDTPY